MTRIRFEDLPSTNTPRNAENLNKLNNVVISATEPTTGEEVWIQKGKKIYTKNDNGVYDELLNVENINNQQNYSTNEQVIGTWIDGKPLYRQIIITTTPSTTEDSIVATIPNNAFARKIEGLMYNDTTSQLVPINFHYSEQYNCVTYIQFDGIHMKVSTSDYTDKQLEIILEYTKTTD